MKIIGTEELKLIKILIRDKLTERIGGDGKESRIGRRSAKRKKGEKRRKGTGGRKNSTTESRRKL